MRLRYLPMGLGFALLAALQVHAAVIYKWTDADGVVHFSDQPQPGAERIVTKAPNISHASSPSGRAAPAKSTATRSSVQDYTAFEIDAPQPQQMFNDSTVTVRLHLEPALKSNHSISLNLNGKWVENQPTDSLIFTLVDLPRGAYALTATVSDTVSGDSRTTAAVEFYVHQTNLLSPLSPLRKKAN